MPKPCPAASQRMFGGPGRHRGVTYRSACEGLWPEGAVEVGRAWTPREVGPVVVLYDDRDAGRDAGEWRRGGGKRCGPNNAADTG